MERIKNIQEGVKDLSYAKIFSVITEGGTGYCSCFRTKCPPDEYRSVAYRAGKP
jgi:hypothetical protein